MTIENPSFSDVPPPAAPRDQTIDILRGFALITITINHITGFTDRMGMVGRQFPTLTLWGFSSAAEIFFLVSGYLVGAVYFSAAKNPPIPAFASKVWVRAGKLYIYNLVLFLVLLPMCWISRDMARLSFYRYFFTGGPPTFGQFLILYIQPYCLEILVTYIVLLTMAPLFAIMLRAQAIVAVLLSIALYWYAHQNPGFNIPGGSPLGDWGWNFNPASWQALFFVAMAAGRYRLLDRLREKTRNSWLWLFVPWIIFAAFTWLYLAQDWYNFSVMYQSKVRVGPVRAGHALSVCWAVMSLFWKWPHLQQLWIFRQCAVIGSNSLQTFVACVAISYAAGFIWIEYLRSHEAYIILCIGSVITLGMFANSYHSWQRLSTKD